MYRQLPLLAVAEQVLQKIREKQREFIVGPYEGEGDVVGRHTHGGKTGRPRGTTTTPTVEEAAEVYLRCARQGSSSPTVDVANELNIFALGCGETGRTRPRGGATARHHSGDGGPGGQEAVQEVGHQTTGKPKGSTMTMKFAFYGRVSTEDQQDPTSSKQWQMSRARPSSPRVG